MNNFTKEELEEIIEMANDIERGSQAHGLQMHFKIRDKAQSMIDSYGEPQLNSLQKETIKQIKSRTNDSKCWNLHMRHNGQTKIFEVDFLKDYFRSCDE
jgi:hypothetical protein